CPRPVPIRMGSRRNQLRARATSEHAKKSAIALSLMSSLLSVASPSCAVACVSRPLCGTAAVLNRPSCHNLLCTILDLADTRNPELYCVAVTVRPDNPSLLAIPSCQDCSGGRIRVVLAQKSPDGPMDPPAPRAAIFVLESSSAHDTPFGLIAAQSKRVK